ncbi:MAG: CoA-binding protein [Pseudomonadota bacterium]
MSSLTYSNAQILGVLRSTKTIAMVGASAKWNRPSYFAMKYLQEKGYRVIPVNPGLAGKELLGELAYADLSAIPEPFQMVDVFRSPDAVGPIVEEAIALKDQRGIETIWMQLGVINHEAAARAEDAGLTVIMDRCPKIEFGRLMAELSWGGFDSGVITAKRRRLRVA